MSVQHAAAEGGARRVLVSIENKRDFLDVPAEIMERVYPIFYAGLITAAMKAVGGA